MRLLAVSHRCLLCSVLGNSFKNICSNLTSNHLRFSQLQNILSRTRFPVGGKTYPESHVVLELFTFGPDSVKILVVSLQQIDCFIFSNIRYYSEKKDSLHPTTWCASHQLYIRGVQMPSLCLIVCLWQESNWFDVCRNFTWSAFFLVAIIIYLAKTSLQIWPDWQKRSKIAMALLKSDKCQLQLSLKFRSQSHKHPDH